LHREKEFQSIFSSLIPIEVESLCMGRNAAKKGVKNLHKINFRLEHLPLELMMKRLTEILFLYAICFLFCIINYSNA
jgi:ABC-type polysaccharide/polyol phosphate export permease